jgi:transcription elongation factor Elf1
MQTHVETREVCGVDGCTVMPTNAALKAHRESHAPKTKPLDKPAPTFQCDICPLNLATKETLRIHKKGHENALVECKYCHEKVRFKDLKGHKYTGCTALPDRLAVCSICGTKTATTHMKRHMRTVHERVDEVVAFARSNFPEEADMYEDVISQLQQQA